MIPLGIVGFCICQNAVHNKTNIPRPKFGLPSQARNQISPRNDRKPRAAFTFAVGAKQRKVTTARMGYLGSALNRMSANPSSMSKPRNGMLACPQRTERNR